MTGAGRRAVTRWSWRLFRREWRGQLLVIGLVSFSVAAAVFGATVAYNMAPSRDAEFGTATHRFELAVSDADDLAPYLDAAREWFGEIEVIGRRQVVVPGSTQRIELRSLDRDGPFSRPTWALRSGRAPDSLGEVAVTDETASLLAVDIGDRVVIDRESRTMVGLVENPADLDDEFAMVATVAGAPTPESISLLVRADRERVDTFRPPVDLGPGFVDDRTHAEQTTAALGVFVVATVAMVLVCLVAGASFVALAHRRIRQLGMLAAVGATRRQIRTSMVANGTAVGVVAAVVGTGAGLAAWIAAAPSLESAAAHRIRWDNVPLWLPLTGAALAVATASVAAWWPARAVSRISIIDAVSARPPRPRAARRSVLVASLLFVGGLVGIGLGIDPRSDEAVPQLFIPGIVAIVVAILLVGAPILGAVARVSGPLPVGPRLAVRDLARYETRSSAALGAITLGLAISVAVVAIAAAQAPGADEGNLGAEQLVVWTSEPGEFGGLQVPEVTDADRDQQEDALDRILGITGRATVVPLDVAVDPRNSEVRGGRTLLNTAVLGRPVSERTLRDSGLVFVATPELVNYLDVDPAVVTDDTLVLTRQKGDVYITGNITISRFQRSPVPASGIANIDVHDYSSAPRTLMTDAGLDAAGLVATRAGWLVDLDGPADEATLDQARAIADEAGLAIEVRNGQGRGTLRTATTAVGVLVALSILAMTVGLLRSDAAGDLRTLTATGATRRIRRALTATTCALLAVVGAVLGTVAAYAALLAGYWPEADRLGNVPIAHLAVLIVGLPLLAAGLAWVVGGRERSDLTRPAE